MRKYNLRKSYPDGFTMIEVLVVVAIIALLISILLPALNNAREQARRVKCLTNMKSLVTAVHAFVVEHKGYAQLITQNKTNPVAIADPDRMKYAYENSIYGNVTDLKAWPVAYAPHLGNRSVKTGNHIGLDEYQFDDLFQTLGQKVFDPEYFWERFGKYDVMYCPSDRLAVRSLGLPRTRVMVLSYADNDDLFNVTWMYNRMKVFPGMYDHDHEDHAWADGGLKKPKLAGRLDQIIRPSEVVMFCDGGIEEGDEIWRRLYAPDYKYKMGQDLILDTSEYAFTMYHAIAGGPFLENVCNWNGIVPLNRHGNNGGICGAYADGSGRFCQATRWTDPRMITVMGTQIQKKLVKQYMPNTRVSPYNPGVLPVPRTDPRYP